MKEEEDQKVSNKLFDTFGAGGAASEARGEDEEVEEALECETDLEVKEKTQGVLRKLQSPLKPSAEEVEEHMLNHCPYRSWCSTCVRGRGKHLAHRKHQHVPGTAPAIHLDYCFLRSAVTREEEEEKDEAKDDAKTLTVLAACDRVGDGHGLRCTPQGCNGVIPRSPSVYLCKGVGIRFFRSYFDLKIRPGARDSRPGR